MLLKIAVALDPSWLTPGGPEIEAFRKEKMLPKCTRRLIKP
jgi:hypothetical protein